MSASTVFIDYNSSGNANDYDVRFQVTGGGVSAGEGVVTVQAGEFKTNSPLRPNIDTSYELGSASLRWSEVFAVNGTINTSDERNKTSIECIPDAVLDAWASVPKRRYKWKDSVAEKGDDARWHIGVIAQDVVSAFVAEGLDAHEYGVLCYDEWEEQVIEHPAIYKDVLDENGAPVLENVLDVNGEPVLIEETVRTSGDDVEVRYVNKKQIVQYISTPSYMESIEAGNRYGVRYSEASQLDAALDRRERNSLKARIEVLEAR